MSVKIGIIGGSGLYDMGIIKDTEEISIDTPFGKIDVKDAIHNGVKRIIPEYEVCKKISIEKGVPQQNVYEEIIKQS